MHREALTDTGTPSISGLVDGFQLLHRKSGYGKWELDRPTDLREWITHGGIVGIDAGDRS